MADALRPGQSADAADPTTSHQSRRHGHGTPRAPASFQQVLMRAFQGKVATGRFLGTVHRAVTRVPAPPPAKSVATLPATATSALNQAMAIEGVPTSWQPSLAFIMAQESSGRVGVHSPIHSARGLYQLNAANYHYNPNGAASFGNAVEEAQGGIRYIRARYGTADNAAAFWRQHGWY
jgi:hypothetical protein